MADYNNSKYKVKAGGSWKEVSFSTRWQDITNRPIEYTPSTHTHGNISNDGKVGSTANLMLKTTTGGLVTTLAAGTTSQYLRGDGTWQTPPNTDTKNTAGSTNNTANNLYIVGATSQSSTGVTTYSNANVYISGNKLYSNGTEVSVIGHTHSYTQIDTTGLTIGQALVVAGDYSITSQAIPSVPTGSSNRVILGGTSSFSMMAAGTAGQVLTSNGASAPSWEAVPDNDTKNTAGSSNTASTLYIIGATSQSSTGVTTYSNANVYISGNKLYSNGTEVSVIGHTHSATDINTGTLPVARGGTGASTLTANRVLLGNGTSAISAMSSAGTAGQVLTSNGTSAPTWQAVPGMTNIRNRGKTSSLTSVSSGDTVGSVALTESITQGTRLMIEVASSSSAIYNPQIVSVTVGRGTTSPNSTTEGYICSFQKFNGTRMKTYSFTLSFSGSTLYFGSKKYIQGEFSGSTIAWTTGTYTLFVGQIWKLVD